MRGRLAPFSEGAAHARWRVGVALALGLLWLAPVAALAQGAELELDAADLELLEEPLFGDDEALFEEEEPDFAGDETVEESEIASEDVENSVEEEAEPGPEFEQESVEEVVAPGAPTSGIEEIVIQGDASGLATSEVQSSAIAFSDEELKAMRVSDVRDVGDFTPNLEFKSSGGASITTIFVRGIGLNDFNSNASSSVPIIVDGVNINSPAGQLFLLFDLEGLEVLRGPQGTLYGRNTTAGAIVVQSKRPGDDFEARSSVTYGTYNLVEVDSAMTVPIAPELLSVRFAGRYQLRDGITRNRCADNPGVGSRRAGDCVRQGALGGIPPIASGLKEWVNDLDKWGARVMLELTPSADTSFLLNVHGGQSQGDARQNQSRGTRTLDPAIPPGFGENSAGWTDPDNDPFEGAYDIVEDELLDLFGASFTASIEFEDLLLESITAYEQNDRDIISNADAAPSYLILADIQDSARQWSQDLRLETTSWDRFTLKAGLFFATEELRAQNFYQTTPGLRVPTKQRIDQRFSHIAGHAFGSFELTESITLEGGVRVAWERKDFNNVSFRESLFNPGVPMPDPPFSASAHDQWTPVTGDLIVTWRPTESIEFYGKYVRGWKTGHFNGGASRPDILTEPVEPETVNAFEVGAKGSFFDDRLDVGAALWFYDYKDYQVFAIQNQPDSLPLAQLLNAQDVESRGFELDIELEPVDGLRWQGHIGWIDAEFGTFTTSLFRNGVGEVACGVGNRNCLIPDTDDFTGNRLPAAPDFTFSTLVEADIPLDRFGLLVPRIDASYKSQVFFDQQGDDALAQAPFWLLNARLTYRTPAENVSIAVWGRNLTGQKYLLNATDLREGFDTILDVYGDPMTFGVTLDVSF